jgi:hypothetical protein
MLCRIFDYQSVHATFMVVINSRWYADVPNHTLDENEMVCGADSLLEEISQFRNSQEVHWILMLKLLFLLQISRIK